MIAKNKKKIPFIFIFAFKSPDNFSIEINTKKERYLLKTMEKLFVYKKINFKKINQNILKAVPILSYSNDEYKNNTNKAGFNKQMIAFKKFILRKNKFNSILFAIKIMSFCKKLII